MDWKRTGNEAAESKRLAESPTNPAKRGNILSDTHFERTKSAPMLGLTEQCCWTLSHCKYSLHLKEVTLLVVVLLDAHFKQQLLQISGSLGA